MKDLKGQHFTYQGIAYIQFDKRFKGHLSVHYLVSNPLNDQSIVLTRNELKRAISDQLVNEPNKLEIMSHKQLDEKTRQYLKLHLIAVLEHVSFPNSFSKESIILKIKNNRLLSVFQLLLLKRAYISTFGERERLIARIILNKDCSEVNYYREYLSESDLNFLNCFKNSKIYN